MVPAMGKTTCGGPIHCGSGGDPQSEEVFPESSLPLFQGPLGSLSLSHNLVGNLKVERIFYVPKTSIN